MKALTVRQPWAWAIINVKKDIENRNWNTHLRGAVAVHAALGMTRNEYEQGYESIKRINPKVKIPAYEDLERGVIIGTVEIVDCVQESHSPWFGGAYGFVLSHPKKLRESIPCRGALKFWDVPIKIESRIKKAT